MAHGNVLTVYSATPAILNQVTDIINNLNLGFQQMESTFFIRTDDMDTATALGTALFNADVTYTCVFIFDSTGCLLMDNNISAAQENNINHQLVMP